MRESSIKGFHNVFVFVETNFDKMLSCLNSTSRQMVYFFSKVIST